MFEQHVNDLEQTLLATIDSEMSALQFADTDLMNVASGLAAKFSLKMPTVEFPSDFEPYYEERTEHGPNPYARIPFGTSHKTASVRFEFRVTGDTSILRFAPPTFLFGFAGRLPQLRSDRIVLEYETYPELVASMRQQMRNDIDSLRRNLDSLETWVTEWNARVTDVIRRKLAIRLSDLESAKRIKSSLRFNL